MGVVWFMGDNFLPGSTLLVSQSGYPDMFYSLNFVNSQSLYWETATPVAGNMTLTVYSPTYVQSTPLTVQIAAAATATSSVPGSVSPVGPAPDVLLAPTSCSSPFLGTEKIYGQNFQEGAVIVVLDPTGAATETSALFISSDEVWWELLYPTSGTYQVSVQNPDGQTTPAFSFTVN